jgi:hypothetical protein
MASNDVNKGTRRIRGQDLSQFIRSSTLGYDIFGNQIGPLGNDIFGLNFAQIKLNIRSSKCIGSFEKVTHLKSF